MALKLMESFDGSSAVADLVNTNAETFVKRWACGSGVLTGIALVPGYTNNSIAFTGSSGRVISSPSLGFGMEIYVGFRFTRSATPDSDLYQFFRVVDQAGTQVLHILHKIDGGLSVVAGPTTINAPAATIANGASAYIEIRFRCSDTVGLIELRKDGIVVATSSPTSDTKGSAGTTSLERVAIGYINGGTASTNYTFDDLYALDAVDSGVAGNPLNTYQGVCRVHCIRPDGDGAESDWVGSDGNSVDNYLLVDESAVNDADYVDSLNDGDRDLYAFASLPVLSGVLVAVQVEARAARLDDAGDPKNLNIISRVGAVEEELLATLSFGGALGGYRAIFQAQPDGSVWTETDINAAQFGYEQTDA